MNNFSVIRCVKSKDIQIDYNTKCQNFVPFEEYNYNIKETLTEETRVSHKNFNCNSKLSYFQRKIMMIN